MLRYWVRFNAVGMIGFAVQLLALAGLMRVGVHYLAATVLAVEAAVLHNFIWHEGWTWRGRSAGDADRVERLWRFHLLNGIVSLIGNLALMRLLVGAFGMPAVPANLLSVLVCSIINFVAGERLVWVDAGSKDPAYLSTRDRSTWGGNENQL